MREALRGVEGLKISYMQSLENNLENNFKLLENNFICKCEIPLESFPLKSIEIQDLRTSYELSYTVV